MLGEDADVRCAQVLTASVRMVNEANSWSSTDQRHLQRVGGQFSAQVIGERPAHDPSAERIQDDGQVQPALPRADVGDVREPDAVGRSRVEVASHQV